MDPFPKQLKSFHYKSSTLNPSSLSLSTYHGNNEAHFWIIPTFIKFILLRMLKRHHISYLILYNGPKSTENTTSFQFFFKVYEKCWIAEQCSQDFGLTWKFWRVNIMYSADGLNEISSHESFSSENQWKHFRIYL